MPEVGFFQKVFNLVSQIPRGKVATYGQIAAQLGTRDSRRIGHALHANKNRSVPCHRVVMKDGSLAPGFAFGGPLEQKKILLSEGVEFDGDRVVMNNQKDQAIKISEDIAKKMNSVAHRYDHANRVRKEVIKLAKSEGINSDDLFLLELSALWHDVGLDYVDDRSKHPEKSAEIFLKIFKNANLISKKEIGEMVFLLRYHDKYRYAESISKSIRLLKLLRILIDADTLELLGEIGYQRAIETAESRHWKMYDKEKPLGKTYGFNAKQFNKWFALNNTIEPTLVGQINFQISCSDLLFTSAAKIKGRNGIEFLKNKIHEILAK